MSANEKRPHLQPQVRAEVPYRKDTPVSHTLTPFTYEGHEVRVLDIGGDPWFVASDVARVLSYRKASDMVRAVDPDEKGAQMVRTPGGEQQATCLTEAGLYSVVLARQAGYIDNPEARAFVKAFQRWVTHEVLPSIRRRGGYLTPEAAERAEHQLNAAIRRAQMAYQPDARENRGHGHGDQACIASRSEDRHRGAARRRSGTEQVGSRSAIIDPGVHGCRDSASGDRRGAWRTPECDLPDSQPRLDRKHPACTVQASGVQSHVQAPCLHPQEKKNAGAHRRQTIRPSGTEHSAVPAYGAAHPATRSAA